MKNSVRGCVIFLTGFFTAKAKPYAKREKGNAIPAFF